MSRTARVCAVGAAVVLLAVAGGASAGAFWNQALTDPAGGTGGGPIAGTLAVTVVYAGTTTPFPGAFVMVGPAPDDPFPDNWGTTGGSGQIVFSDPALAGPVTVTAGAAGYQFLSLVDVDANDLVLALEPVSTTATEYQVGDNVTGCDVNNGTLHAGDGYVDMAFVLHTVDIEFLLEFELERLLGPTETVSILGTDFEIPSNIFIPQQWEFFIEINKNHYYLYLPAGDYTLAALAGRIDRADLLAGGEIIDLIPAIAWREIDILDVTVTGPTLSADLNVDPDLALTATLNIQNIPPDSTAYGISAGDLDDLHGLGRVLPLGFSALDCPPGAPCSGSLTLSTAAAAGELAGMGYFPALVVEPTTGEDKLALLDRASHPQTYSATMATLFQMLDLDYTNGVFGWTDAENPAAASPPVDLGAARLLADGSEEVYWKLLLPGDRLSLALPVLPPAAPPGPTPGLDYVWEQSSLGLTYGAYDFDFNEFAFTDIPAHVTHLSLDRQAITLAEPPATPTPTATATPAVPPPIPSQSGWGLALLAGALGVLLARWKSTSRTTLFALAIGLLAAAVAGAASPGDVVINEVMYDSTGTPTDEEWVELHNTTAESIDIGGWILTDDNTFPEITDEGQLELPDVLALPAGGYLVVAKTEMTEIPGAVLGLETGSFTLGNTGDNLALYDTLGELIDGSLEIVYPDLAPSNAGTSIEKIDESSGWSGDSGAWNPSVQSWGGTQHVFCSPGLENSAQGTPGPTGTPTATPTPETTPPPIGDLVVNEYMPNPQSDWDGDLALDESMDEWVELFNSGASPIDLTGISIGDNTNPTRYTFVSGTLDPDCWVVVYGGDIGPTGFGFNNSSADTVWLTAADGTTVLDQHSYTTATNDIAKRRLADGGATWGESPACAAPGGGPSCPNPNASNDGTVVCLTAPTATPTPEPTAVPTATPTSGTAHEVFIPFWQQGYGEQTFFSFYNAPGAATGLDLTLFLYDEAGQWLDSAPPVHLAPGQMYLPDTGNDPWYDSGSHFGGAIAMIDYDSAPTGADLFSAWAAVYAVLPDSQPGFTVPVPQSPLAPASGTSAIGVGDGQVLIPYWEKRGSAVTFYALWNSPHSAHTADIWITLRDHSGTVVGSNQSVLAPGEVAFVETVPPFGPVSDMVGVGNIDIDFGPETDPDDQVVLWSTVYGIYGGTQVGFPVALELPDTSARAAAGRPSYSVQSPFWQVGLGLNTVWSFYNAPSGITVDLHLELADLNGTLLETSPVLTLAAGQGGIIDTADVWYEAGWQVGVASIVLDYAGSPSDSDIVAMWSAAYSDPQPGDARTGFTVSIPGAPAVPPALAGAAARGSRQGEGTVLIPFWQEGLGVHTFWSIGNSPDSNETATVTLRLRDAGGTEIESAVNTLAPGQAWMTETWEGWYTAGDDFGAGEIEIDYPTPDDPANQVLLWEAVYGYFQGYQVGYPVELR